MTTEMKSRQDIVRLSQPSQKKKRINSLIQLYKLFDRIQVASITVEKNSFSPPSIEIIYDH